MTAAEDALVKSTIELLPGRFQKEKETLAAGARNSTKIREKIISHGMSLDTGLEKEMAAAQELAGLTGLEL